MKSKLVVLASLAASVAALFLFQVDLVSHVSAQAFVASDPGVRSGDPGAGGPLAGLVDNQGQLFLDGLDAFAEVDDVPGGLGPRMNLDSCAGCHAQPATGGSSPFVNPQVAFANKDGGTDTVPSFITANGPVREARFVKNPDKSADGGVHALFTITGRTGADVPPGPCILAQPDFAGQLANGNVIFRVPTPTFGAGLIEQIPDSVIVANAAASADLKAALGIKGKPNVSGTTNNNGNDGTIARFGWKAQNKSLLLFSGEAYNVEQGISNELFQTEREEAPACQFAATPNDAANTDVGVADPRSDVERFAIFMRFLAPPTPSPDTASIASGRNLFWSTGCGLCHTPALTTGWSKVAALSGQTVNLYSDLVVHDMGEGLADGVSQGGAGPREFRTAPLWGLGQRIFFLHDGRTSDLVRAIQEHSSKGSEANGVIARFNSLLETQKQDVLNFLRAL